MSKQLRQNVRSFLLIATDEEVANELCNSTGARLKYVQEIHNERLTMEAFQNVLGQGESHTVEEVSRETSIPAEQQKAAIESLVKSGDLLWELFGGKYQLNS